MADQKTTQLTALAAATVAVGDLLPIADVSVPQTKSIRADALLDALVRLSTDGLAPPANSPAQIAANTDDYAPGVGLFQRWNSDAARNVTGMVAGADGETRQIWNVGSFAITLKHETTSTAANRFTCTGAVDIVLGPGEQAWAQYSTATSRWLVAKVRSDVAQGTLIARRPGGVAGTDELQIYCDATQAYLDNPKNSTRVRFDAGQSRVSFVGISGGSAQVYGNRICASDGSDRIYVSAEGNNASYVAMTQGSFITWTNNDNNPGSGSDTSVYKVAPTVVGIGTGGASGAGWIQNTAGDVRVANDVNNATATLATATGLTVTLVAGRKYGFLAKLNVATGAVLEGVKAAVGGTATVTNLIADIEVKTHDATPVFTNGRVTTKDSAIGQTATNNVNISVEIEGTFECNVAGTMLIEFAKNASTGATNTTVKRGSWLRVWDIA